MPNMDIKKFLPQPPTEGPPLPKLLEIKWPEALRQQLAKLKR